MTVTAGSTAVTLDKGWTPCTVTTSWSSYILTHQATENPFADMSESDWFYQSVLTAYENGWMAGTTVTTFSPDMTTDRGMIAIALQWACGAGLLTGKSGGILDPQGEATRAEVATILARFVEKLDGQKGA